MLTEQAMSGQRQALLGGGDWDASSDLVPPSRHEDAELDERCRAPGSRTHTRRPRATAREGPSTASSSAKRRGNSLRNSASHGRRSKDAHVTVTNRT